MVGLSSIKVGLTDQYIKQTGQVDNLLYFLQEQEKDSVELLALTGMVAKLKVVNDRMHDLIEGRVNELIDKELGAFAFVRKEAEAAYSEFCQYLNAWAKVHDDELGGEAKDLADFIEWANAQFVLYRLKVQKLPTSAPEAGDVEGNPDDVQKPIDPEKPDGEPVDPNPDEKPDENPDNGNNQEGGLTPDPDAPTNPDNGGNTNPGGGYVPPSNGGGFD